MLVFMGIDIRVADLFLNDRLSYKIIDSIVLNILYALNDLTSIHAIFEGHIEIICQFQPEFMVIID